MGKELLSVIVPVYNVEKYLRRCLDSILEQKYTYLDIVLIDDGSTDDSGKICDEYASYDSRITVIHKKNKGLVAARKDGLRYAKGRLVTFVDSDDIIAKDMYEAMMSMYEKEMPNIIISGLTAVDEADLKIRYHEYDEVPTGVYNREKIISMIFPIMMWNDKTQKRGITSAVWNKIFEKELLDTVMMNVDDRLTLGEDAAITYPCIGLANKIVVFRNSWYQYVCRSNSMVRTVSTENFEKIHMFQSCIKKQFEKQGLLEEMELQIEKYLKTFLRKAIKDVYECEMERIRFLFPFHMVPQGSRIVIYGGGQVGKAYWNCLRDEKYVSIVGVVDENYKKINQNEIPAESPERLQSMDYDYIVIAVKGEELMKEIKGRLVDAGISRDKILWENPRVIW